MTLTIVPRTDAGEPLLCPWDDTPLHRVGKVWRCPKHDIMSKVDLEFMPFDGRLVRLGRHSLGMSESGLANALKVPLDALQAIEAGDTRPERTVQQQIAEILQFPLAFFMQPRIEFGETSLDWHMQFAYCECGHCLCMRTETMPLICPRCHDPCYGCPHCDADMHVKERHSKTLGYAQAMFVCERCEFKANTAEMLEIVKAQTGKEA